MSTAISTSFKQQRIVIVGGTSGMGLAAANIFSAAGADVIVGGRSVDSATRVTTSSIRIEQVDATSTESLDAFFNRIGNIDHLIVTVSGAQGAGHFADLSFDNLRAGFAQKFWAHVQVAQLGLRWLRKDGSLTFVTAASARSAIPGTAGLAAINGAIEAMVKPLARELQPLRVNAVSPGVVETSWWDRVPEDIRASLLEKSASSALVKRNGSPEELGEAIAFIVGNHFISGTVLEVDGGIRLT